MRMKVRTGSNSGKDDGICMKLRGIKTTTCGLMLVAGAAAAALLMSTGTVRVSAESARNGQLHIIKDCTLYTGLAGGHCTIVSSNLAEIPVGSVVHYSQALGVLNPAWLDSNIVLDAGNGNKAVGRCTVDFSIQTPGVCTFSDGTGQLAGFTARVDVSTSPTPPADFTWDGTYSFNPLPPR